MTMHAARLHEIGGSLQLDEVEDPVAGDGEVVVDIAYASVNPLDIWVTRGAPGAAAANLPWVPGTEAAGYLDGAPVLVRGAGLGVIRHGLYRERAAVPASAVAAVPAALDLAQVAGLGVVGFTAWHCLHTRAQITPADRVLVMGASGGVGSVAVQLAKAVGATVWGHTGSAVNVAAIREDGADDVVVSDASGLEAVAAGFAPTVVLDPLGGAFTDPAMAVIAERGRFVVLGTSDDELVTLNWRRMYRKGVTVLGYTGLIDPPGTESRVLSELYALMAERKLRIRLGAVLPLADAAQAHARILDRTARGKLVLDCRA